MGKEKMTLDEVLKDLNKKEVIATIGLPEYDYVRVPFSSLRMNYCTFGGLPIGKIVEFFGPEHGGKTTTALDIVANFQRTFPDRKIIWLDIENTLDPVWATKLGVDLTTLTIIKPTSQSAEEILEYTLRMIETGEVGLVVLDSLAAMVSQQAMEKDITERTYGGISVAVTNFAPKAEMLCQKYKCLLIGINQVRDVIGSMFPMQRTPGGRQWLHLCVARFEFNRGKFLDDSGEELSSNCENPAGNIVLMKMVKNKTCPPTRRVGSYCIDYMTGVNAIKDVFDLAQLYEAIIKRGSMYDLIDLETGTLIETIKGKANVYEYLKEHEDICANMTAQILNKMEE